MNSKTKRVAFLGVMTAFALVLSYVELLLPPIYAVLPAVKVGLPNIIIVFMLYKTSLKEAAAVSLIRLLAVVMLFGNAMTFLYSIAGAVLSLAVMALLKKSNFLSTLGVSIAGAVSHNLGQIIVAALVLNTSQIGGYMPVLAITGTLSGIAVGILSSFCLKINERYLKI